MNDWNGRMMTCLPSSRPIGALIVAGLLSACAVGPDYRPQTGAQLQVPERFNAARPGAEVDLTRWWTSFDDPVLANLVERSLAANLDVAAAGARLRQARAAVRQTQGQALPQIGASGSVSRSIGNDGSSFVDPTTGQTLSRGGDSTVYRAGLDASWEADIFGGIRRSVEAARASADGTEADLHFTQLSVAAEVGLNYVTARLAQARLDIARRNLASQDETLQIVGWRVQAGLVSALDLEQARQLRANTAATIPTLETTYTGAVNRIAVLLGEAPGAVTALLNPARPVPLPPRAVGVAIPAEIVQRRPDIAGSERTLAAEVARIGVAEAQLYPALRLTGSFSGSETSLSNLPGAMIGNIASAITAPIFQGGQIRAQIEGQRAATDAALANYRQTVLLALEEVENALTSLTNAERRAREVEVAAQSAETAVVYARSQYRAGLIDFQALLESERSLLSAQDSRASARADRANATVQLYKALGGGWQAAPQPAPISYSTRP